MNILVCASLWHTFSACERWIPRSSITGLKNYAQLKCWEVSPNCSKTVAIYTSIKYTEFESNSICPWFFNYCQSNQWKLATCWFNLRFSDHWWDWETFGMSTSHLHFSFWKFHVYNFFLEFVYSFLICGCFLHIMCISLLSVVNITNFFLVCCLSLFLVSFIT